MKSYNAQSHYLKFLAFPRTSKAL